MHASNNLRSTFLRIALCAYVLIASLVASFHERWFDEAQAWLIARDATMQELLWRTSFEGPMLWHFLLKILTTLEAPYALMTVLSIMIATIGVIMFMRWSPFSTFVTATIPFTYFFFYQYAVVARSYVLIPLVLFSVMLAEYRTPKYTVIFFTLVCILANTSVHGLLLACSILVWHLWRCIPIRAQWSASNRQTEILGYMAFGCIAFIESILLWPSPDYLAGATPSKLLSPDAILMAIEMFTIVIITMCTANKQLYAHQGLVLLVALIMPQFMLNTFVYYNAWHEGILWLCLLIGIGTEMRMHGVVISWQRMWRDLGYAVIGVHLFWTIGVIRHEITAPYSGAPAAAKAIQSLMKPNTTIAMMNHGGVTLLPYFPINIFANFHAGSGPSYMQWSKADVLQTESRWFSEHKPDYVLINVKIPRKQSDITPPPIPGYRLLQRFPGWIFWKTGIFEEDSFAIYERISLETAIDAML